MVKKSTKQGQIVFIRLKNFMSFDCISLHPGFHLNFIIGPNGTGKSTFICAIILGLGGKLKSLGRADRLGAYVKNGCHEGTIEIELYEPDGQNILITRKIYSDNRSEFFVNGKAASASMVNDIRLKYNIHLDNLCTFLPQERVQDFSKLNSQQLLDQTQKTVGFADMVSNYESLKELYADIKNKEKLRNSLKTEIEEERQKNDRLKDKVKIFLEKRTLCDKLTLINQKKSWLTYFEIVQKMKIAARDFQIAQDKWKENKKKYTNISEEIKEMDLIIDSSQETQSILKHDWAAKKATLKDCLKKLRKHVEHLEDFDSITKLKLVAEKRKKQELNQYQETLNKMNNDLQTFESVNGTDEQLKLKEENVNAELIKKQKEESKLMEKKVAFEDESEQIRNEIKNLKTEYRILEKRRNFRLEYLKRYEPDVFKAVEWLEQHFNIFQDRIFKPMLLELDVIDVKYAKYVEARIGYRDLISFTCTNPEDLNLLIQKLRIEQKLKINAVCSEDDDVSQYNPEIPLNQIRTLGFFSYLKDLISGPNHIIRYLCKIYKIHSIPIGEENVKHKCDKVPAAIPIFFSEHHMFTVKVSVYSGDKSINVKQLNEPKLFSISLDNERMEKILQKERELVVILDEKETKIKLVIQYMKSAAELLEEARQRKRDLAVLLEERKQIVLKIRRVEENVNNIKDALKDPSAILEEANKDRQNLRKEIKRDVFEIRDIIKCFQKILNSKQECEIKHKIKKLRLNYFLKNREHCLEKLNNSEEILNNVKTVKEEIERNSVQVKEAAKKLTNGLSPGEKGFEKYEKLFKTLKNTIEELETEMEEIQVMADFLSGGNAQILQEYEKREERIENLNESLRQFNINLEETKTDFARLRNNWFNSINELVFKINENFSNFFEAMGCAGEVSLTNGDDKDDFDQYGITIKVKFRNEVPLQNLGRHFQSGGERAVATAVYLLSLQELIFVPFRFVDEINQGMDSANERRIINLMIDVTSKDNSSQYFFITPKLLSDIKCSEKTIIHCIYSGRKTISSEEWNLQSFLSKA